MSTDVFLLLLSRTINHYTDLKEKLHITALTETVEVNIRFSETDPMGIVWHGNYLKYLEDGREAFGAKYGIGYMDIYKQGFAAPLVEIDIKYKKALRYGESILIETRYVHDDAAKIIFAYKVMNAKRPEEIIATANSIQVFLDLKGELLLTNPQFYQEWKMKYAV